MQVSVDMNLSVKYLTESESWLSTQIHKMTDPTTQQRSYPSRRASSFLGDFNETFGYYFFMPI
jgi:hypothetical protein